MNVASFLSDSTIILEVFITFILRHVRGHGGTLILKFRLSTLPTSAKERSTQSYVVIFDINLPFALFLVSLSPPSNYLQRSSVSFFIKTSYSSVCEVFCDTVVKEGSILCPYYLSLNQKRHGFTFLYSVFYYPLKGRPVRKLGNGPADNYTDH